jgi:hypothetical protein
LIACLGIATIHADINAARELIILSIHSEITVYEDAPARRLVSYNKFAIVVERRVRKAGGHFIAKHVSRLA